MAQQTVVEWLVKQLKERGYAGQFPPHLLFEQAKQMEKEQIIQAYKTADQYTWKSTCDEAAEQYYNEIYGKE